MKASVTKIFAISMGLLLAVYGVAAVKKVSFIDQAKCIKCGTCEKVCPAKPKAPQKTMKDGKIIQMVIDPAKCLGCGLCNKKCPKKAITLVDPADITSGKLKLPEGFQSAPAVKVETKTEKAAEPEKIQKPAAPEKQ
jgi:formate hydrogenlyase subunit 6/NADH:ubiquinone oxidoreductase subunit I